MKKTLQFIVSTLLFLSALAHANLSQQPDIKNFIQEMTDKHQFNPNELAALFDNTQIKPDIITLISKPAEKKPWYQYQPIFVNDMRVKQGVEFWNANEKLLTEVSKEYGVPPEIIVAILGAETNYGRITGSYRVMDALTTLAFEYPPRADFFRSELEQFLLLSSEQHFDPLSLKGSYAGAMGYPQFMPSNYRTLAIDHTGQGKPDLFHNVHDIVASIANYFKFHGWQTNQPVAYLASASNTDYKKYLTTDLKPTRTMGEWQKIGVRTNAKLNSNEPVVLIELESKPNNQLWLGLNNFYVITRYNRSPLYAMAVYQLSEEIKAAKNKS